MFTVCVQLSVEPIIFDVIFSLLSGSCDEQLANQLDGQNGKKRLKSAKQWKKSGKDDKSKIIQEERSESLPLQEIKSESNTSKEMEEQQAGLTGEGEEDEEDDELEVHISRMGRDEIL